MQVLPNKRLSIFYLAVPYMVKGEHMSLEDYAQVKHVIETTRDRKRRVVRQLNDIELFQELYRVALHPDRYEWIF